MAKGIDKRRLLFDKFSKQLHLLKDHGFLTIELKFHRTYICPICLRQFSENDLLEIPGKNYLTLEDAPPDSLGGSKIALTCKECNSGCGHKIDAHLTESIRAADRSHFYKGTKTFTTIDVEGRPITVELESLGNGSLLAHHSIKHNNPSFLDKLIYGIKNKTLGPSLNFNPPKAKFDPRRADLAVIKTNYVITFAKFGYIFILDERYSPIRLQLRLPEEEHFPWVPFLPNQFPPEAVGTFYILNNDLESILNVFSLKTEYSETVIGSFLPIPSISISQYAEVIDKRKDKGNGLVMDLSQYDLGADLFTNVDEIRKVHTWMYRK